MNEYINVAKLIAVLSNVQDLFAGLSSIVHHKIFRRIMTDKQNTTNMTGQSRSSTRTVSKTLVRYDDNPDHWKCETICKQDDVVVPCKPEESGCADMIRGLNAISRGLEAFDDIMKSFDSASPEPWQERHSK